MSNLESFEVAGVPIVVRPPANPLSSAPLIVLWHGFGVPNSPEMLAEVLPLNEVQAWKAYLGLPLFGRRLPPGGLDEIMRRQMEDYVLQLLLPSIEPAMQELPNVVQALQTQFGINEKAGIGLFGFSAGGLAALLTSVESPLPITAMVLAGVTKDLVSAVGTYERATRQYYPILKEQFPDMKEQDIAYHWSEASEAAKQRLDFVARASEIARAHPLPAILFVHGLHDEAFAVSDVEDLKATLTPYYSQAYHPERLCLQIYQHLGHQLDLDAAKQSPDLKQDLADLQQAVATWFSQHLS